MRKIKMLNMNIYCLTSFPPFLSFFLFIWSTFNCNIFNKLYHIFFKKNITFCYSNHISWLSNENSPIISIQKKKSKSNKGVLNCSSAVLHIKPNFKKNYKVFFLSFIKSTMSAVLSDDEIPLAQRVKGKAMCFLIRGMLDCNTL